MKDMCTLGALPKLIEAGIDSFKIEGRMKKPAYAAGVTAIYRKYIDLYYEGKGNYQVDKKDMDILKSLYIRSGISEGYYFRHNGKEMISISSPAYSGADDALLAAIDKKYIASGMRHKVRAKVQLAAGEPARLTLERGPVSVTETGDIVQEALKQPLTEENREDVWLEVRDEYYDMAANATGIDKERITIIAYESPVFIDKETSVTGSDIVSIVMIVLILALLAFVVLRSMRSRKAQEGEEELSVESMLQSTPEEVNDIEVETKSDTRMMIEKFVDDNPEAAANLLRNWLNEDWG